MSVHRVYRGWLATRDGSPELFAGGLVGWVQAVRWGWRR